MSYWFGSKKEQTVTEEPSLLVELSRKVEEQATQLQEQAIKHQADFKQIHDLLDVIQSTLVGSCTKSQATLDELQDKWTLYVQAHRMETILYYDGSLYQGELCDHKPNGYGTIVHGNGTRYMGEWKDGLYHGSGVLYYPHMMPWYAEWNANQPHGYCTYDGVEYSRYEHGIQIE